MSPKRTKAIKPDDDSQDYPTDPTATGIGNGDENGPHVSSIRKNVNARLGQSKDMGCLSPGVRGSLTGSRGNEQSLDSHMLEVADPTFLQTETEQHRKGLCGEDSGGFGPNARDPAYVDT